MLLYPLQMGSELGPLCQELYGPPLPLTLTLGPRSAPALPLGWGSKHTGMPIEGVAGRNLLGVQQQ